MTNVGKKKGRLIFEGKTKILYEGNVQDTIILHFKDDISTYKNKKVEKISGKGAINNRISEAIMHKLSEIGIPNHFIKNINMKEQLVHICDIIPITVKIRNIATGSICEMLGIEDGSVLPKPILEFHLKNDELNCPLLNEDHLISFNLSDKYEIKEIKAYSIRINDFLCGLFHGIGIRLIDINLEFGRSIKDGIEHILLADEISPDTCRLWDIETNTILDIDRFNKKLGEIVESYREVAKRLKILDDVN